MKKKIFLSKFKSSVKEGGLKPPKLIIAYYPSNLKSKNIKQILKKEYPM